MSVCVCFLQEEAGEDVLEGDGGGRGGGDGEEGKRVGFLRGFTFFALDVVEAPRIESCVCVYVCVSRYCTW